MYTFAQADLIWNRACGNNPLRSLPGDRALADLLKAHNLTMNGGVFHAVECLAVQQMSGAESGYRYFGLDGIVSLFSRARQIVESGGDLEVHERALDREYAEIIPSDELIGELFKRRLKSNPSDFAQLRAEDMSND